MKNKIKTEGWKILFLILLISAISLYYVTPKEVKFEDVFFENHLNNRTGEYVPYTLHFSLINSNFKEVNCISILNLQKGGQINKTRYETGKIPQRTKLKYNLPFNMPVGNTSISLINECNSSQ